MKRLAIFVGWLGFALLIVAISAGLLLARQWARDRFQTSSASQAWLEWKDETESAADEFTEPVQRRPAVSSKPPTLVLLENHFWVCWSASVLISGVIYWTFAILLSGALQGNSQPRSEEPAAGP